jgi:hypothetical protein
MHRGIDRRALFVDDRDRVGSLFQGRFRSVPIEGGVWALELSYYVHLNPLRTARFGLERGRRRAGVAGIGPPPTKEEVSARLKRLREYRWSSYRAYAGYVSCPHWLCSAELLTRSARAAAERQRAYRSRVQGLLRLGIEELRLEQLRDVVAIGSATFVEKIRERAGEGTRENGRRGRLRYRWTLEEVVEAVKSCRGEPRAAWLQRHGDPGRWLVLKLARAHTGMTLRELGKAMGGMDYASVSVGLRRYEARLRANRGLQAEAKRAVGMLNV